MKDRNKVDRPQWREPTRFSGWRLVGAFCHFQIWQEGTLGDDELGRLIINNRLTSRRTEVLRKALAPAGKK